MNHASASHRRTTGHRDLTPPWVRALVAGPLLGLLVSVPVARAQDDTDLGTLLYSASERAAITRTRSTPNAPEARPEVTVMSVNGIVHRKNGHSTVWINGQPVREGMRVTPDRRLVIARDRVTIGGKALRVGETMDLAENIKADVVRQGAVSVKTMR